MINEIPLYSGSDGNALLVTSGESCILVDCGGSCRSLEAALASLGISPMKLGGIFITHEHSDHISAAEIFSKKYSVPIHITEPSSYCLDRLNYAARCAVVHPILYSETVGELEIRSFALPHDSAANVGYLITDRDSSFGVATDMGEASGALDAMRGCDAVMIEANHDIAMLKSGPYPASLKARILSRYGHLSNDDCASLAVKLADAGTKSFRLAHLSRENNQPKLAVETVFTALDAAGHGDCSVSACIPRSALAR